MQVQQENTYKLLDVLCLFLENYTHSVVGDNEDNTRYKLVYEIKSKLATDFKTVLFLPEHVDIAEKIIMYYRKLVFVGVGGKINGWEQKVLQLVQSGEVYPSDIGVVGSMVPSYYKAIERDRVNSILDKLGPSSEYIPYTNKVTQHLNISVLKYQYIRKFGCNLITCVVNEKDIAIFFTGTAQQSWIKYSGEINARIKRHQENKFMGYRETVLTHVTKRPQLSKELIEEIDKGKVAFTQ